LFSLFITIKTLEEDNLSSSTGQFLQGKIDVDDYMEFNSGFYLLLDRSQGSSVSTMTILQAEIMWYLGSISGRDKRSFSSPKSSDWS
jgi:hypothetical protein